MLLKWNRLLCKERRDGSSLAGDGTIFTTEFERDYYTIVTSSYFRRLKDKTQIYTMEKNDLIRDRMTHSVEVACIAEIMGNRIADFVIDWEKEHEPQNCNENLINYFRQSFITVLKCAGLLHDMGNPPFGHSGEGYIREWMDDLMKSKDAPEMSDELWADLVNFEGNAQNLHIISRLGKSSDADSKWGFDLTYAVMGSIIKYPVSAVDVGGPELKNGKIGYYHSEKKLFDEIESRLGLIKPDGGYIKNPIALIMEAADDVAYRVSDLEDSLKKGNIDIDNFAELLDNNEFKQDLADIRNSHRSYREDDLFIKERITRLTEQELGRMREQAIDAVCTSFTDHYEQIMNGEFAEGHIKAGSNYFEPFSNNLKEIYADGDAEAERSKLTKDRAFRTLQCLWDYAKIDSAPTDQDKLERIRYYYIGSKFKPAIAENNHVASVNDEDVTGNTVYKNYYRLLSVADFMSGMTDDYVGEFLEDVYSNDSLRNYENKLHLDMQKAAEDLYKVVMDGGFDKVTVILNVLASDESSEIMNSREIAMIIHAISDETVRNAAHPQVLNLLEWIRERNSSHRFVAWFDVLMKKAKDIEECSHDIEGIDAYLKKIRS